MKRSASAARSPGYQLFMLTLCLYAISALTVRVMFPISADTDAILEYADDGICALFLIDFVVAFVQAPNRLQYMLRWGWLDLLSSIPVFNLARWGRAARVLRIFRVLRALKATRVMANILVERRAENTVLAASLIALMLVVFCSIALLHFESEGGGNIKNAEDAIGGHLRHLRPWDMAIDFL